MMVVTAVMVAEQKKTLALHTSTFLSSCHLPLWERLALLSF